MFCCFPCFESRSLSMLKFELILSSVLIKDQNVKATSVWTVPLVPWLKLIQALTPTQTRILDTTCIFNVCGLRAIGNDSEEQPASIRGQQS
jgi:hypothetical protein